MACRTPDRALEQLLGDSGVSWLVPSLCAEGIFSCELLASCVAADVVESCKLAAPSVEVCKAVETAASPASASTESSKFASVATVRVPLAWEIFAFRLITAAHVTVERAMGAHVDYQHRVDRYCNAIRRRSGSSEWNPLMLEIFDEDGSVLGSSNSVWERRWSELRLSYEEHIAKLILQMESAGFVLWPRFELPSKDPPTLLSSIAMNSTVSPHSLQLERDLDVMCELKYLRLQLRDRGATCDQLTKDLDAAVQRCKKAEALADQSQAMVLSLREENRRLREALHGGRNRYNNSNSNIESVSSGAWDHPSTIMEPVVVSSSLAPPRPTPPLPQHPFAAVDINDRTRIRLMLVRQLEAVDPTRIWEADAIMHAWKDREYELERWLLTSSAAAAAGPPPTSGTRDGMGGA